MEKRKGEASIMAQQAKLLPYDTGIPHWSVVMIVRFQLTSLAMCLGKQQTISPVFAPLPLMLENQM